MTASTSKSTSNSGQLEVTTERLVDCWLDVISHRTHSIRCQHFTVSNQLNWRRWRLAIIMIHLLISHIDCGLLECSAVLPCCFNQLLKLWLVLASWTPTNHRQLITHTQRLVTLTHGSQSPFKNKTPRLFSKSGLFSPNLTLIQYSTPICFQVWRFY